MSPNKLKKFIAIFSAVALVLMTSACAKKQEIVSGGLDNEGNLVPYNYSNVSYEGMYYIKRGDLFYPLCPYGMDENYQWFTSKVNAYIPTFTNGDTLVYINIKERPSLTQLTSMNDCGYTIGTIFSVFTENGEPAVKFSKTSCAYSPVGNYIASVSSELNSTKIVEINSKAFTRNMVDNYGFIHGLTEGAMYKFGFYEGTVFKKVSLKADTRVFINSTIYSSTSYRAVKNIFYEVVLPENLPNGYYSIPGYGLFLYNMEDNIILPEGVVTPENDSEETVSKTDTESPPEETTAV